MPKLKNLSGDDTIKIFQNFGFIVSGQKGSHIKLKRIVNTEKQVLTVPRHQEMDKSTLKAIYRQSSKYIPEQDLKKVFYTE